MIYSNRCIACKLTSKVASYIYIPTVAVASGNNRAFLIVIAGGKILTAFILFDMRVADARLCKITYHITTPSHPLR